MMEVLSCSFFAACKYNWGLGGPFYIRRFTYMADTQFCLYIIVLREESITRLFFKFWRQMPVILLVLHV